MAVYPFIAMQPFMLLEGGPGGGAHQAVITIFAQQDGHPDRSHYLCGLLADIHCLPCVGIYGHEAGVPPGGGRRFAGGCLSVSGSRDRLV